MGKQKAPAARDIINRIKAADPKVEHMERMGFLRLYRDGTLFGTVMEGHLFLKAGEGNTAEFERAEVLYKDELLIPPALSVEMDYRQVPAAILQDKDILALWVNKAVAVARDAQLV